MSKTAFLLMPQQDAADASGVVVYHSGKVGIAHARGRQRGNAAKCCPDPDKFIHCNPRDDLKTPSDLGHIAGTEIMRDLCEARRRAIHKPAERSAMTSEFVGIDTLTDAEHVEMHALSDAELAAVAGGMEAKDIIILNWVKANFPSLLPSVFTQGGRNVC